MKSRTSFFNPGVLKKDIFRFSPLWGIYTVCMLLYLFLFMGSSSNRAEFAGNADNIMSSMGVINFLYGALAALLLFGDLFKSRLCNALHAMPLRREGWFFTHFTAGMLFCIVPNILGAAIASLYLGQYAYLAWIWLAVVVLEYLCFFALGVFSIQLAGNALGALAVYFITNFLTVLLAWLLISFYDPVLFGINLSVFGEKLTMLSPVIRFVDNRFVKVSCTWYADPSLMEATFSGFIRSDWLYLFSAAGIGLVLLGCSLLLYRKRNLENAGDLLAVKAAKPVFLLLYTLAVGAVFYLTAEVFNTSGQYILLIVGFLVGYFTGWMLLEKRLKVFRGKRFLKLGIFITVFFLTVAITWLDPLGVTRYIPESDKVASVTISPYSSTYYRDDNCRTLTSAEDIDTIRDIHRQLLTERNESYATDSALTVTYTLKNGTTVLRQYHLNAQSPIGQTLKGYYSHMEALFGNQDLRSMLLNIDYIEYNSHQPDRIPTIAITDHHNYLGYADPKEIYGEAFQEIFITDSFADNAIVQGLLDAIEQDCREGNMAQLWEYHKDSNPTGYLIFNSRTGGASLQVHTECKNTVAYLKTLAETYAD